MICSTCFFLFLAFKKNLFLSRPGNKKNAFPGLQVIIPQAVGLAVLRGAVLYGLDPSVVNVRRATRTYGIGIIRPFDPDRHPQGEQLNIVHILAQR